MCHLLMLGHVEAAQVELPGVGGPRLGAGDGAGQLLLHHVQAGVHSVVQTQLLR